ncbi:hypothetical protein H9Y04_35265 [Streptomyces sp. TRM66268-LWL]|uniref:Uncharacterized protein n=1 Tax=Streptomyces polyasparticus TaxID=2767826 RepID=A0ABR7SSN5_9ACTN|nr:hypothetical protein [Streptomyces polyasparticus]MBC9717804.1 hypothetical protein [Streptomyces polyasparticus]
MTLVQPPFMTHGGRQQAQATRLLLHDLVRGGQGIAGASDLKVSPLQRPACGVRVADGSAIVHGTHPWQGAYGQVNVGDALVDIDPTGPFARTDLLVLRVEDPEYEGDRDPAYGDIGYFHVIQGVGPETVEVPVEMSAIPLARISLPRDTGTVTADMIKDLRQLANSRHQHRVHTAWPDGRQRLPGEPGRWTAWPTEAAWDVDIPAWASKATVTVTISSLQVEDGGVLARLRTTLGTARGKSSQVVAEQGATPHLFTTLAHTYTLTPAQRGVTQRLAVQANQDAEGGRGGLFVDRSTAIVATVDFTESPE